MADVEYTKTALKTLLRLPADTRVRLATALTKLASDPAAFHGDWKPLAGSPYWRLRVGGYRAVCDWHSGALRLLVLKIGSRGDVYK